MSDLKPGWLNRQIAAVNTEIATWPDWMKTPRHLIESTSIDSNYASAIADKRDFSQRLKGRRTP